MKKFTAIWSLACLLALLAVCGRTHKAEMLDSPPDLTVSCGAGEVTAWRGSYTWEWGDGITAQGVCADSPHPLDVLEELPILAAEPGDRLTLTAAARPDGLSVYAYRVEDIPASTRIEGTEVSLSGGNTLVLPENGTGTVYEVRGTWDMDTWGGSACYAFYVPEENK